MIAAARERPMAFKKSQPRTPRLARRSVEARGLSFAVLTSPAVAGMPLVCVNGGMLYSHAILWPAIREALGFARWDMLGHSWGGGIAMLAAARDVIGVRRLLLADAVGSTSSWIPSLHPDALARLSGAERAELAAIDSKLLHADDPGEVSAAGAAVAARLAHEIAALAPRAHVQIVDGAGHMPFLEQPEEFFAAVRAFLDEPDAGS